MSLPRLTRQRRRVKIAVKVSLSPIPGVSSLGSEIGEGRRFMSAENDELVTLVKRWCAVDADGVVKRGRFDVYGGTSSSRARKSAAGVPISGNVADMVDTVSRRIAIARAEGPKRLFVRVYETGESAPSDGIELPGDPGAMPGSEDGDSDAALTVYGAHALMLNRSSASVEFLIRENAGLQEKNLHLVASAAAAMAELEVYKRFADRTDIAEAVKSLAPTLEKALPAAFASYIAAENAKHRGRKQEAPPSGIPDTVRDRLTDVETAVQALIAEVQASRNSGTMTDGLFAEVSQRVIALVQLLMGPPPPAAEAPAGSSAAA